MSPSNQTANNAARNCSRANTYNWETSHWGCGRKTFGSSLKRSAFELELYRFTNRPASRIQRKTNMQH